MNMEAQEQVRTAPERTCVGCRSICEPGELERFVLYEGHLYHDLRGRAPGRGAWVMPTKSCLEGALRNGFMRSFRTKIATAPSLTEMVEQLHAGITKRLKETLQTGMRARHVSLGQDAVAEAMRKDQARLIWLSDDVGGSTHKKFEQNAARKEIDLLEFLSKKELGAWLGHDFVVILALTDTARAQAIVRDVSKLRQLSEVEG